MEDSTEQAQHAKEASEEHATAEPSAGQNSGMAINGIDVREMQAAFHERPRLVRWRETSTALLSDMYDLVERLQAEKRQLVERLQALEQPGEDTSDDAPVSAAA